MILLEDILDAAPDWDYNTSITVGTFDGVHIGHRYILQELIKNSRATGDKALVVTFDRHPMSVLKPDSTPKLLTTQEEKLFLFEKLGIDITCVLTFTRDIANLTTEQFTRDYLIKRLKMNTLFIGYDHGFGKRSEKSPETFQKLAEALNFTLRTVNSVEFDGLTVKSSLIRTLLAKGNVEKAAELIGEDYSLQGKVIRGDGRGKKIGIPTANIEPGSSDKILPGKGAYAGWAEIDGIRKTAVINMGSRPTFNIHCDAIETHIIDFQGDLYGKDIRIGFTQKLRNIVKFNDQQDLLRQINSDIETTKKIYCHDKRREKQNGNHKGTQTGVCDKIW
ncbi:bifunctional riboflavin kinase/FAD synthetase [bacterium]|nr:bifunctional riboflavin kinase/FAD synthetase [bacterium]